MINNKHKRQKGTLAKLGSTSRGLNTRNSPVCPVRDPDMPSDRASPGGALSKLKRDEHKVIEMAWQT